MKAKAFIIGVIGGILLIAVLIPMVYLTAISDGEFFAIVVIPFIAGFLTLRAVFKSRISSNISTGVWMIIFSIASGFLSIGFTIAALFFGMPLDRIDMLIQVVIGDIGIICILICAILYFKTRTQKCPYIERYDYEISEGTTMKKHMNIVRLISYFSGAIYLILVASTFYTLKVEGMLSELDSSDALELYEVMFLLSLMLITVVGIAVSRVNLLYGSIIALTCEVIILILVLIPVIIGNGDIMGVVLVIVTTLLIIVSNINIVTYNKGYKMKNGLLIDNEY